MALAAQRLGLKNMINNFSWLFFDRILRMVTALFVGVWLARYLGPGMFGQLNFAIAFVGLFAAVGGLGLQAIIVREIVKTPSDAHEIIGTGAVLQLLAGLLAYCASLAAIYLLRHDDIEAMVLVAIVGSMLLFKAGDVAIYWFEAQLLSKYSVIAQTFSSVTFSAVKVALIVSEAPLSAFAWSVAGEAFVTMALLTLIFRKQGFALNQLRFVLSRAKMLLLDSWPLLISGVTIMIYLKIDQIMLGEMLGSRSVGIYSAALRISEIWYFIPMIITSTTLPAILNAKKSNQALYEQRLQLLYDIMVVISLCVIIPMIFVSTPMIKLAFGAEFSEAGPILMVHIWASLFVFLGVASGQWFVAENRQILSLQRSALGAALNVLINYFAIPVYGGIGAALATLAAQFFTCLLFDLLQKETRPMFFMKIKALNIFRHISTLRSFNEKL
jgi:O-antigen/teichoic acid export membrane protein